MATVHLGRLLGPVGFARIVAVKRLHAQFAEDPEFVSMFLDEARLAARIHHPNVIPIVDVVAQKGELLLVMDYVKGENLARLSPAGRPLSPVLAAHVIAGVLHGLHAAHEATDERGEPLHIVHRDVSPQNVLVGVDGIARVLDFGVAKAAGRIQTTREGQLKGKIAYMAPEQLRGEATRQTDIYAASVVLWELLTGRRLFAASNELETLGRVIDRNIEPPGQLVPNLPRALEDIVMRGLGGEPEERWSTAQEMALELEEAMPSVSPSKVGAWVESVAAEALSRRAALVSHVEGVSTGALPVIAPAALVASAEDTKPDAPKPTEATLTQELVLTQLSSSAAVPPRSGPVATAGPARRGALVAVAIVALASVSALAFGVRALLAGTGDTRGLGSASTAPVAADPASAAPGASVGASASTRGPGAEPSSAPSIASAPAASASAVPSASVTSGAHPKPVKPPPLPSGRPDPYGHM